MSQIEVDKIIPQSGTALQVGENGDTITVPAGATLNLTNATVTYPNGSVQNVDLANSSITINGSSVSLGGSVTIGETKPTITGSKSNSNRKHTSYYYNYRNKFC